MFIQVAIDTTDPRDIERKTVYLSDAGCTRIEVGTVALLAQGLEVIKFVHSFGSFQYIYADTKLIDFTSSVLEALIEQGLVNGMSMHLTASDDEITSTTTQAREHHIDVYLSSIGMSVASACSRLLELYSAINPRQWGIKGIIVHGRGNLDQARLELQTLELAIAESGATIPRVLAGGLRADDIRKMVEYGLPRPDGVIMGRGAFEAGAIDEIRFLAKEYALDGFDHG